MNPLGQGSISRKKRERDRAEKKMRGYAKKIDFNAMKRKGSAGSTEGGSSSYRGRRGRPSKR